MPPLPELLAPAGQPDAGYAALHYGADAVYLGLGRFSARAEAVNFGPEELAEFAAYAHSLAPARKVYLTLNTLVQDAELADAAETLAVASECGVDAVIAQDLGVTRLVRTRFPRLALHASTQMAIHNADGVLAARDLGCARVTLARELTLDEIAGIAAAAREAGIEIETFIHGTLCYSYSGLCLFSSMTTGRSGNRGRCVYTCREAADTPSGPAHPFSLKDMALGDRVRDLAAAGVGSLKIEGRKKSPLYVAATVDYYRRLLDGRLSPRDKTEAEDRLKTIFARPWTDLFLDGPRNPDAADPEVVGHRGAPLGRVGRRLRTPAGPGIAFTARLALERHDGIQADVPGDSRPYGFPVDNLYLVHEKNLKAVFEAPAGSDVAVALPPDAPALDRGVPLYQSSSQAVKRSFPFFRPKAGAHRPGLGVDVEIRLAGAETPETARLHCLARLEPPSPFRIAEGGDSEALPHGGGSLASEITVATAAMAARDAEGAEKTARAAFDRTGGSGFHVAGWRFDNPDSLAVRPGEWNRVRRDLLADLSRKFEEYRRERVKALRDAVAPPAASPSPAAANNGNGFRWSLFVEDSSLLDAFADEDIAACDELFVGVDSPRETLARRLEALSDRVGREKIVLAAPLLTRRYGKTGDAAAQAMARLRDAGWRRWLVPGLWAWRLLSARPDTELIADWPLYALNRLAVRQLADMGFSGVTLSPEDDADNMARLLASDPDRFRAVVFSHLPLFISAACAHSHIGLCPSPGGKQAKPGCAATERPTVLRLEKSGPVEVWPQGCGSVVVGAEPFSLAGARERLGEMGARRLRVDFRWRRYPPEEAVAIWRGLRSGAGVSGSTGNFRRGLA